MSKRNKSLTERVNDEEAQKENKLWKSREAHNGDIQDAKLWRDHWRARAAEEDMQDEGYLYVRPLINRRLFLWAGAVALVVYGLLTAALVLIG